MRWHKDQQEAEKTKQVGVIYIQRLIEKKEIGVAEKEQQRAQAIKKSDRNKQCEEAEKGPMNIKPVSRPRMNPGESIKLEQEARFEPTRADPVIREVGPDVPDHEKTKRDSKKNERSNLDRRERARPQSFNYGDNTVHILDFRSEICRD